MKLINKIVLGLILFSMSIFAANAGDFDWMQNLNIQATADSSGFKASLRTRFRVGDAQINAVIGDVDRPADAYMILRLGELSHKPVDYVVRQYRINKGKGWGVLAKSLGIKPGSREFHALKAGHDLKGQGKSARKASSHGGGAAQGNHGKGKDKKQKH